MEQARSKSLQQKLCNEALAIMELGGHGANVTNYEQAIRLVGKACGIPRSDTEAQLDRIRKNRDDLRRIESGEKVAERVFKSEDYIMANWTGMEILGVLMDIFEASLSLERCGERQALFNMAQEIIEVQTFTDWIEKSPEDAQKFALPSA